MIVIYLWFTIKATNWRVAIRRTMNESDTDANTKAIDSLLNYETVKYFGAEEREAARYDKSMATYEKACDQDLHVARHPQLRPGGDLHDRADDLPGDVGAATWSRAITRSAISSWSTC